MNPTTSTGRGRSLGTVPPSERLLWMLAVRLAVVGGTVSAGAVVRGWELSVAALVAPGALLVLAGMLLHLLSTRVPGWASTGMTGAMVLDALYLGWALYLTGGTAGPVVHLISGHVLAVTLLTSFRAGLTLALGHSLVVMSVLEAVGTGLLPVQPGVTGFDQQGFGAFVAVIWVTALIAATLAAVNERELRRRRYDEEQLRLLGVALHGADSGAAVATALLELTRDAADAHVAAVYCHVPGRHRVPSTELAVRLRADGGTETLREMAAPAPGSVFHAAGSADRTVLADVRGPDDWVDRVLDGAARVVVVPFSLTGQVSGVVAFAQRSRGARVERRRIGVVEQAVAHAATAFARVALLDHLRATDLTDGLTGVANRRALDAGLDRELSVAARTGAPLCVVRLDLDHVEQVDDVPGHEAGDDVLRAVGPVLRDCVRQGDLVARYGGNGFAVVMPAGSAADGLAAAHRLREALRQIPAARPVTASIGLACWPSDGCTRGELLVAAGQALIAAQAGGRNEARLPGGSAAAAGAASIGRHAAERPQPDG